MAPYHILIVIISSVIPENLVLLTKSEQSGPESAHICPTNFKKGTFFPSPSHLSRNSEFRLKLAHKKPNENVNLRCYKIITKELTSAYKIITKELTSAYVNLIKLLQLL